MVESTTKNRTTNVRKKTKIKDLVQIKNEIREAAEPLTILLEERTARLETAPQNSVPYILKDIQTISDGITNTEAMLNKLLGYFVELSDENLLLEKKCQFLEGKWRGASNTMLILKNTLHKLNVPAELMADVIFKIRNQSL